MTSLIAGRSPERTLTEDYFAVAFDDSADTIEFFSGSLQQRLRLLELLGRDHDQHSETHVEGAEHLFLGYVAESLQMFKDGKNGPGAKFDHGRCALGENPGQVLGDAAPGDVRQCRYAFARDHLANNRPVAAMSAHQFVADLVFDLANECLR